MERTTISVRDAAEQLEALDAILLAAVPGSEPEILSHLLLRRELIDRLVQSCRRPEKLQEIQRRTIRLGEKFLHWRRTAIMDLSTIDQHLRYLNAQAPSSSAPQAGIDFSG
ncbi:MAG: hypothetical protein HYX27_21080 [Acidobacteria bacterium]|nr:hypothetical protein [Acidobacteriota bacterium]